MVNPSVDDIVKQLADLKIHKDRLNTREDRLLADLKQARLEEKSARLEAEIFGVGDHVEITNKITHALRAPPGSHADRIGVVTSITKERVHLITFAGTRTCRARKNLKLIAAHKDL